MFFKITAYPAEPLKFEIVSSLFLLEYSEKNSISMVLQKQNVVIGKKELDITKDIILILNEKIKKIDIN